MFIGRTNKGFNIMSNTVTLAQLNNVLSMIAKETNAPTVWFNKDKGVCVPGALRIEQGSAANGILWKMVRCSNERGGENSLLGAKSKRELLGQMNGFLEGMHYMKENS